MDRAGTARLQVEVCAAIMPKVMPASDSDQRIFCNRQMQAHVSGPEAATSRHCLHPVAHRHMPCPLSGLPMNVNQRSAPYPKRAGSRQVVAAGPLAKLARGRTCASQKSSRQVGGLGKMLANACEKFAPATTHARTVSGLNQRRKAALGISMMSLRSLALRINCGRSARCGRELHCVSGITQGHGCQPSAANATSAKSPSTGWWRVYLCSQLRVCHVTLHAARTGFQWR